MLRLILSLFATASLAFADTGGSFATGDGNSGIEATVQQIDQTVLRLTIANIPFQSSDLNGEESSTISLPEEFGLSRGAFLGPESAVLPTITRLLAIPFDAEPSFTITRSEYREIPDILLAPANQEDILGLTPPGNELLNLNQNRPLVTAEVAGVMRDLRLYALTISPVSYDPESRTLNVCRELEIEVSHSGSRITRYEGRLSEAFAPIYRSLVDNPTVFDPIEITRGAYWVIYPDAFASNIQPLLDWKKAKGFDVVAIPKTAIGSNTYNNIKNYIIARFDSCMTKPDYIVIMGDVTMPNSDGVETRTYSNPWGFGDIESDNAYTFIEGGDYFPEVLIGRISFDTQSELNNYFNKFFMYEKNPYMSDTGWYHRGVVVAGSDGYSFTSPRLTKLWCREAMMERGFTQVDTFFAEHGGWELPAQIANAIDNGVAYVNYRGYGTADSWMPPYFGSSEILGLANSNRFPIMTSIVCGTGDYEDGIDVCMGETWIRANNKGGAGFIGNSNHDAHTRWTNALDVGIYWGWFDEDVTTMAQALLMGKMTLYNAFPLDRGANGQVELYFNSYNNLGDPEINCWTDIPRPMQVNYPDSIQFGQNRFEVHIQDTLGNPVEGAAVCIWKGAEVFSTGFTDNNGDFRFLSSPASGGGMQVTATARNYIPYQDSAYYYSSAAAIGYTSHIVDDDSDGESLGDADGILDPSERIELPVILTNYGVSDTAFGVFANLSCLTPGVTVSRFSASYLDIAPGQAASPDMPFFIRIGPEIADGVEAQMILDISDGGGNSWQNIFNLPLAASRMVIESDTIIDGANGIVNPGETVELVVAARNLGGEPLYSSSAILKTADDQVLISDSTAVFGNIMPDEVINNSGDHFAFSVGSDIYNGHIINFIVEWTGNGPHVATSSFAVQVGVVTSTDPLGPDNYGYYCFDQTDTTYLYYPRMTFIDIDIAWPYVSLGDDDVETIDLPFPVQYYGQIFDEVSICDNGFVALGRTWWPNFYNSPIPGPQNAPAMVAPFWDDFVMSPGRVYYHHDEVSGWFVIGWRSAFDGDNGRTQTFEIVILDASAWPTLTNDNEILFMYQIAQGTNLMSAGICSPDRRDGLGINFNGVRPPAIPLITNGGVFKFTTGSLYNVDADEGKMIPSSLALQQNYPNPFNATTQIGFGLPAGGHVKLEVLNILGQRVAVLADGEFEAGNHSVSWKAAEASSGIYFYRLETSDNVINKRMTLLK
jgi:hypothetical protein